LYLITAAPHDGLADIPLDWSSYQDQLLIQNQGSFVQGSDVCCSMDSPDCQVQIQNQAGEFLMGYSLNATAMLFGDGTSIVSLFATMDGWPFGVEMDVSADMACVDYCPNEFPLEPYNVVNYTDKGPVVVNGVPTEQWQQIQCLDEKCL
jgi:hypothetical protein